MKGARQDNKRRPAWASWAGAGGMCVSVLWALSLMAGLLFPFSAYAEETRAPPVSSGCEIDYPPFCIVHEDGRADGFSVELMRAALGKMGRKVTFRTGPWAEVRGWLERGEVKALPLVGRTPERELLFDFTVPYMTMHGAIVVRKETADVRSLADLRGRRVGVMKGDNTEEFLRREDRGFEIVTTPMFSDAFHALAEGRCDAVVIQRLVAVRLLEETGLTNLKIVDRPVRELSQDFCFAVKEGDREMLSALNGGLALALADGTHRRLHAKWFAHLELPADRPIVVGGGHNYPPFEFLDEKGRPAGFTVELTRAIAREVGMDVRIQLGQWEDMVNALRDGKIDALEGMFYSPERDRVLDFSPRYLVIHCVSVVRKGEGPPPTKIEELEGRDLVVQAEDAILDALAEHGIKARITTVETQEDVVRAVAEDRNACGLGTRLGALYAIKKNGWTNLEVGDRAFYSGQYCYAVPQGNEALLAEFTEGLQVLKDSGEYQRIYEKWLGTYEPGMSGRTVFKHVAIVGAPLLLIVLLALFWSWSLRRQVSARTRELRASNEQLEASSQQLRYQEILLREMGQIAHVGGWEFDPATGQGTWTDEVARIHDLDPADETSMEKGLSFYQGESRPKIDRAVKEAIESGKPYDLELELVSAKGVHKWVRTIGRPVIENGKVVRVRGSFQDITERKLAESRIEHLNRVLRAIRDVNQLITHEADRDALLRRSCELLVSTRGYRSAWVALRGAEGVLEAVAEYGIGKGFGAVRERLERGQWPECYRRVVEHPDGIAPMHDPSINCKTCALANNYYRDTAALAGRLRHAGRDYGVLVVALPKELADDAEEQSLFRELIGDVSYALQAMETEQARIRNERTLQAVFQSASEGILLADAESGRLVLGNDVICRMLGYSEDEITRLSVADIHPAEALEHVRAQFDKQARGEITLAENLPVKRKDGTVFPADVSSAPLELDGRRHLIGIFRDITQRKKAEKALKEASDIVNRSSSVAFTWKNAEGWPVEFVSENVERLLGYKAEEFINGEVSYSDCIHVQDLPRVVEEVARMSAQEKTVEFVHEPYRLIAKDGSEKFVRDWTFIVRDNDGRITHYKGIVEDITKQRSLEAQLAQAQKMEAVGRLAGGVAHDYNNILSVIIGYSELAMGKVEAEDPLRADLKEIYTAAKRSKDITRQLLAFARKEIIALEVLDLNAAVKNMIKILRKLIGENIDLAWHPGQVSWPVFMDPSQLDQVLANLCVNARDAIADVGRITIETGTATIDADYCSEHAGFIPGEFVLLVVSDDGCGMDRETVDHIFEPFFTTKGAGKGTGLGLSTVYGIVKQNNGFINVYSEPGKGATFKIYLARHEAEAQSQREKEVSEILRGQGETVLIVEDEQAILTLSKKILEQLGYKALTAASPGQALALAQDYAGEIHLLITDVIMPEMNGRQLAEDVQALYPKIEVLFMSGYTANVIAHRGVLDEGVNFIQKPFSLRDLAVKVRRALES